VNRATIIATVIGRTNSPSAGVTTFRPSTADRTEIAGVIIASPKNSDAARIPIRKTTPPSLEPFCRPSAWWARAMSESVPPSPRLSARRRSSTYLMVTTRMSAQMISESTPMTISRVTPPCADPA
jgi:hypothetical protein